MGESPPPDRKEFVGRVGTFFVLVGIGLMVFFILSESAKVPTLSYFCWGTVLLTCGLIGKIKAAFKPKPKEKKEEKKK